MLKPINESYNNGRGDSLYEQSTEDEEKFVLKSPAASAPAAPEASMGDEDMGMDVDMDVDMEMGGEDEDIDIDVDVEDEDDDMGGEESWDGQEETPTSKSIQKLTGKLGQKMREFEDDMDSDMIKYVLNSIISAIDLDVLDEEDRDDIMSRLEPEEDEYGMEDDFEIGGDDFDDEEMDDEDMEMDGEDMEMDDEDMGMGDSLEESLKNKVKKTLKKYYKETKGEKVLNENKKRKYINKTFNNSYKIKHLIGECETLEQELTLKKLLKRNSGFNLSSKTRKGTLVLENKGVKIGINKRGTIRK